MARVGLSVVPEELQPLFDKSIAAGNRYIYVCYRRVLRFFNRERELDLLARSYLVEISNLWFELTSGQRTAWADVGALIGLSGWKLFVSDTSERMNLSLPGTATPSEYHQVRAGYIEIVAPATSIKIAQKHPRDYVVKQRIPGTQSQFAPVPITEDFALPLTIGVNFKTDLTSEGAGASARFYAKVRSNYQGRNIYTEVGIDIPLSSGWDYAEATLSEVVGPVISYEVFLECVDVSGELWFDNPVISHSGQNWARDPLCDDINETFSYAYRDVIPNWEAVDVPAGASFSSFYNDD